MVADLIEWQEKIKGEDFRQGGGMSETPGVLFKTEEQK